MALGKRGVQGTLTLFPTAVPNLKQALNGPGEETYWGHESNMHKTRQDGG